MDGFIHTDSDKEALTSICSDKRLRFVCNKYIKIPMHIGITRPYIIIPELSYVENGMGQELEHILYHEIMHYRKKDLLYKWFALLVASLHWFNPFMIIVRRNINNACEFACDESVIRNMTSSQRIQYGETLINLSSREKIPSSVLTTTLSEYKSVLKERIININKHKDRSLGMSVTALILAILLVGCGSLLGPTSSSPLPDIDPQRAEKQIAETSTSHVSSSSDTTSGSVPETIDAPVKDSPDLPLSLPERLKDLQPKPLNKDSVLPPLELPSETVVEFPDIYAWQYSIEPADFDAVVELAEGAANRMWDNVTRENLDSTYTIIKSGKIDTEYGPYQERISVSYDNTFDTYATLSYAGLWELYEETPHHYNEYTEREISELIGIAKDFADNMIGLEQYTMGTPIIQEHYSELIDHGLTREAVKSETARITWRYTEDGLPVSGDGLTVKLINGSVAYLNLMKHELSRMDVQEPDFLLDADEALYCINYTRSHITSSEDSIFMDCPLILSMSPILSNVFSEDRDIFVPTWEFIIAPEKDNPGYTYAIHVNAITGEIHTNTNEGKYPSPYES